MVAKVGCLVVMVSLLLAGSQSALMKKERECSQSLSYYLNALSLSLVLSFLSLSRSLTGS